MGKVELAPAVCENGSNTCRNSIGEAPGQFSVAINTLPLGSARMRS